MTMSDTEVSTRSERPMVERARLSDEQVTFLLTILRNANRPLTTAELVEALRTH